MSQLWALVSPDGRFVLRFTRRPALNPRRGGCAREIHPGIRAHRLGREPVPGERVEWERGAIVSDLDHRDGAQPTAREALVQAIKDEAGRRIWAFAPQSRQNNALFALITDPGDVAARDLFGRIKAVRDWSTALEARAAVATSPDHLRAIAAELESR